VGPAGNGGLLGKHPLQHAAELVAILGKLCLACQLAHLHRDLVHVEQLLRAVGEISGVLPSPVGHARPGDPIGVVEIEALPAL
jgi:hypothetical protein